MTRPKRRVAPTRTRARGEPTRRDRGGGPGVNAGAGNPAEPKPCASGVPAWVVDPTVRAGTGRRTAAWRPRLRLPPVSARMETSAVADGSLSVPRSAKAPRARAACRGDRTKLAGAGAGATPGGVAVGAGAEDEAGRGDGAGRGSAGPLELGGTGGRLGAGSSSVSADAREETEGASGPPNESACPRGAAGAPVGAEPCLSPSALQAASVSPEVDDREGTACGRERRILSLP